MRCKFLLMALCLTSSHAYSGYDTGPETSGARVSQNGNPASASAPQSFLPGRAESFHQKFTPHFTDWFFHGGDYTRYILLNTPEFFLQSVFNETGTVARLPVELNVEVADFLTSSKLGKMPLARYVDESPTDGAIIVHKGKIVFEAYPRMKPGDVHIWFSISKTVASLAVSILEQRGLIDVSKPIDFYLAELKGSTWAGVPVIDVLDMASGVDCSEAHADLKSCFWNFYNAFGWPVTELAKEDPWRTLREMRKLRPSGEVYDYSSVNTEVLNRLVTVVSGDRYADFVEREIWGRVGAQSTAFLTSTPSGNAFSAGGMISTLRDLARYGLLFSPSGRKTDNPVVSDTLLSKIQKEGRPELTEGLKYVHEYLGDKSFRHNTYQWDIVTSEGDFYKAGVGGQGLYISPSRDLVIAWFGTHTEKRDHNQMQRVARQLAKSGLFDD